MARQVLGRGLDALLPRKLSNNSADGAAQRRAAAPVMESAARASSGELVSPAEISVELIDPNPAQPRQDAMTAQIEDLAESIRRYGVLQPILARARDGRYQIIAGERRYHAAKRAGLSTVPVLIREVDDAPSYEIALIENLQREDLDPMEEAEAFEKLASEFKLSHDEIAKKLSKSRAYISNSIRLIGLPSEIRDALRERKVSVGQVRPLIGVEKTAALLLFQKIIKNSMTAREVEDSVRQDGPSKRISRGKTGSLPSRFKSVEDRMVRKFGRKVGIHGNETKGHIRIEYYSKEDLITLVDQLLAEVR